MKKNNLAYTAIPVYTKVKPFEEFTTWKVLGMEFTNKFVDAIITLHHQFRVFQSLNLDDDGNEMYKMHLEDVQEIQIFNEYESFSVELSNNVLSGLYRIDKTDATPGFEQVDYVQADLQLINAIKKQVSGNLTKKLRTRTYIGYNNPSQQAEFTNMRYVKFISKNALNEENETVDESGDEISVFLESED